MKKKYINSLLLFIFGLFFSQTSQGQIIANYDQGGVFHSNTVQIAIQNVLGNDTLNGIPVTLSDVTITQISATSANVFVQPNGTVVVNPNTPNGSHEVVYQICENANLSNCDITSAFVNITPAPPTMNAVNDAVTISTGLIAPQIVLENVLSNDLLNGIPVSISQVNITQVTPTTFMVDPDGNLVLVSSGYQTGTYTIPYYVCEQGSPNNCDQAFVTVTVINSLLTTTNASYQDLNGDGVTNVGDVINYTYSIANIGTTPVSNVSITATDVNINGGPPIALLNNGASDSTTYTGVHVITQEEINNGEVIVSIQTNGTLSGNPISVSSTNSVNLNIPNGIHMSAFLDYNGNGTRDNGEPNFTNGSFQYELNNNGTVHNITSTSGTHYLYETNPSNSYDFGYTIDPQLALQYAVSPSSYSNITVANGSGIVTYNFAVTQIPYNDLAIFIYNSAPPRPGFNYYSDIGYRNYGNQTIASGTITYTTASNVSITTYPAGAVPTATGFTLNFTNLLAGEMRFIFVGLQVPTIPTVNLGDLVTTTVSISVPPNDININNNTSTLTQAIVGSWDPNDKAESHGPQIQHSTFSANDYLTYTIRFENTGTAEAINIRVTDVLDADLDETTVRMVAASHPYVLDRVGSNLTWRFDGVNLEPSIPNNQFIGHGYIVFQVKPKAGYVIGDIIPNTANIYFDFNPAIVTNTWTTEFVLALGTSDFAFDNFVYHPNPVKNSLTISNNEIIDTIEITSVLGQKVKSIKVNNLQTEIDFSELTSGMYFVKVSSLGQEKTVKIIKE
ncbi:T9SS type A sorting domain-containing protein [Flavobacterium terrisoli]|uniref:T9SS type A sorting domain-containing protein n=1 Tax=Flavobacterium terrisoli TaxID=3242195 RepID=UPI002542A77D|nr:T9SS type A sorting domain-containing protein [Flavobacterium buctense]